MVLTERTFERSKPKPPIRLDRVGSWGKEQKNIDRSFFSEEGKVGNNLAAGRKKLLEKAFVKLVKGFGGHSKSNVPLIF
jgi:hypothetical protein